MATLLQQMFSVTMEKSQSLGTLSEMSHFYDLEKTQTSVIQKIILWNTDIQDFKTHKTNGIPNYKHKMCNVRNTVK